MPAFAALALLAGPIAPPAASAANTPDKQVWNFRVLLDGQAIGEHRFSLSTVGDRRTLVSEARFTVKFLGITVYRYRHSATEQWRGDCLSALESSTDDDGQVSSVHSESAGDAYRIHSAAGSQSVTGCVMSYAYWNPAMRLQSRLLNAQTGRLDAVRIDRIGNGAVEAGTQSVEATRLRIVGPAEPVDVWYSAQGDWIALDASVRGDRKLSYRLLPSN